MTIPSGGQRILQSSDLILEPWDLRGIVDPDNTIEGMNEGNNIYCDSEHMFWVWAGHGRARSDVEWVAHNVRFPRSGELIACGRPDICGKLRDLHSPRLFPCSMNSQASRRLRPEAQPEGLLKKTLLCPESLGKPTVLAINQLNLREAEQLR